jgi:ornithine cyclodeaminase
MAGAGPIPSDLRLAESPRQAVEQADVVCTATTSSTPVFSGADIAPGAHINAIGGFTPNMAEVDSIAVRRASVFVDSRSAVLAEAGELIQPIQRGEITADWIRGELGDVLAGRIPGRTSPDEITLFKSVGVAVQDAAAAARALSNAIRLGLGQEIRI